MGSQLLLDTALDASTGSAPLQQTAACRLPWIVRAGRNAVPPGDDRLVLRVAQRRLKRRLPSEPQQR